MRKLLIYQENTMLRYLKFPIMLLVILTPLSTKAIENKNIIYKYKQYESIDLGDMQIKGEIVAPGDLTVKERDRRSFSRDLLNRVDFKQESLLDIIELR